MVKNPPVNAGDMRHGFNLWVRKIPRRRTWKSILAFLSRYNPTGHRSLEGLGSWGHRVGDDQSDLEHSHCSSATQFVVFCVRSLNSLRQFSYLRTSSYLDFLKNFLLELLYRVVLIAAIQQSESAEGIHGPPLFWISFPFRSWQSSEHIGPCVRTLLSFFY